MHRVTVKTSTIFIAKGGRTKVYRSVEEMPRRLRQELEQSTNGFNSANGFNVQAQKAFTASTC